MKPGALSWVEQHVPHGNCTSRNRELHYDWQCSADGLISPMWDRQKDSVQLPGALPLQKEKFVGQRHLSTLQNVCARIHIALARPRVLQNTFSPNSNLQKWGASAQPCWVTDSLQLPAGDCHNSMASMIVSPYLTLRGDWDMIPDVHARIRFVYGESKTLSIFKIQGTCSEGKCCARLSCLPKVTEVSSTMS